MKWINSNGVKSSKTKLVYYGPDYRGLHAKSTIKKG